MEFEEKICAKLCDMIITYIKQRSAYNKQTENRKLRKTLTSKLHSFVHKSECTSDECV